MNHNESLFAEVSYLILLSVEGKINKEQLEQLDTLLQTSSGARAIYFEVMNVHLGLESLDAVLEHDENDILSSFDTAALEALAEYEKVAPTLESPVSEEVEDLPLRKVKRQEIVYKINKSSIISILATAAAILCIIAFARLVPVYKSDEVATLVDSVAAKWAAAEMPINKGVRFFADGRPLILREGLVKLEFDTHAQVVIESPAEFRILTDDQIELRYGRLYATVPQEAIGFSVNTQTAKIIDLGTEFGVQADIYGDTFLHVVRGRTTLIAGTGSNKISMEVIKGSARKVSGATSTVSNIPLNHHLFARTINSANRFVWRGEVVRFNLADVVGGGNGLGTGQIGKGISLTDGSCVSDFNWADRQGNRDYWPVDASPFVDGVIVPDSDDGILQVSSKGHMFRECPDTNGLYFDEIRNGGLIRMTDSKSSFPMLFNQVEYGTVQRPLLFMHSNACITFDLDAIRSVMPGFDVTAFRSRCVLIEKSDRVRTEKSDVFVLVNGETKFKQVGFDQNGVALDIDIPLTASDHFLTLVATDGGDSIAIDWIGFTEPYVLLQEDR